MRCTRGRAPCGQRAVQIVQSLRTRNISVCCAMSCNGVFLYKRQTNAYNSDTFKDFISDMLSKLSEISMQGAVLVMDNVPFHKVIAVKEMVERVGHVIKYLPAYSPFLNPIENMFTQCKQLVRTERVSCEDELVVAIDTSFSRITQANCQAYYENMLTFMPRCIERENIIQE
jgi:transposase